MLFEVFDSITDGWLKTRSKTWHAPKTLKTIQLNLIIWHVLGIPIQNQTNFKNLPQNMTCLKILAQNQTRFEKLVSKCEAARKIWMIKMFVFITKKYPNRAFQYSTKMPTVLFLQCKTIQRNCFFKAIFAMNFDFPQKIFLQNLKHCKKFDSKSEG